MKSTLIFAAKFWWAVVRLRLFPTGRDNTSDKYRVLGFFVARAVTTTLEPYKNLHAHIDDMEERPLEFPIAEFEESEDDVPFIDLLAEKPKEARKRLRDGVVDEGKSYKKKNHKNSKQERAELRETLKWSRVEEEMCIEKM
ncbi:hypothetical protein HAX54_000940 [Datura stramonium]|uniref:Uncharacterized protein n=1 Tax=Datura stramonium TaxID=4076 RepID=A0ABS8T3P1_DATST|nr:hypothetical protein [Datura stramonium]